MSKRMKLFLTLSLIANVVLIGWIAGMAVKHSGWDRSHHEQMAETLPPELKQEVEAVFEQTREQARALHDRKKEAMDDLRMALSAQQFDEQAFNSAASRINDLRTQMMQLKAEKTRELAKRLSAQDRRMLAGHLMRGGKHHKCKGERGSEFKTAPTKYEGQDDPNMTPMPE